MVFFAAMKVLMVVHQFPPKYMTGTELYAMDLGLALIAAGHEVAILSAEGHPGQVPDYHEWTETYRGMDVHYLQATRALFPNRVLAEFYRPFLGSRFVDLLEEERFDVVHFFHFLHLGVSLLEEAWIRGVPTVVHLMDFWTICPRFTLLKPHHELCNGPSDVSECVNCMRDMVWTGYDALRTAMDDRILSRADIAVPAEEDLEIPNDATLASQSIAARSRTRTIRRALSKADAIVAPSRFLRSMLVKNGWDESSMRILTYAVADALGPAERGGRTNGHAGNSAGGVRFGFMGSFVPHKGPHVVVEAFRKLDWPEATLTMYGDPKTDPRHSVYLRQLADGDPRIRFPGGYAREEIRRVHSEVDVLVAPSIWYENTPFVMLEAQAAGIPIVASNLGGLAEIVEEGKSGFLFEAKNPAALAQVLARFRDDPSLLERLRAGVPKVKRMSEHVGELVSLYEEVRSKAATAHEARR
jgi:glycosyltransferase involved in cell wall biosynthesis